MSRVTLCQAQKLLLAAGMSKLWAPLVAGFIYAESGGTPTAVQETQPYTTTGWGLWQITPGDACPTVGVDTQILTPAKNAACAKLKFDGQGPTAWLDDKTWTAWHNAGSPYAPTIEDVVGYVKSWCTTVIAALLTTTTPDPVTEPEMIYGIVEYQNALWSVFPTGGQVKKYHLSAIQVALLTALGAERLKGDPWTTANVKSLPVVS